MTFEERMLEEMTTRGMDAALAKKILDIAKGEESLKFMKDLWGRQIEGYPISAVVSVWMSVMYFTASWIETNQPLAFYRPQFEQACVPK